MNAMPATPNPPTRPSEPKRSALVRIGTLFAGVLLLAVLFVFLNYFGWKYYKRFDWTKNQLYSLSERTRNVLRKLDRDVDFVVFLAPEQQHELYQPTTELLQRYGSASRRVHVRVVDLEKNPLQAQQLVKQYGVTATGVVVASGNDKRVINSNDLAEIDFSGAQEGGPPKITGFKGEQLFTSAILQLSEGKKPKILFTTGHGEPALDEPGRHGLSEAQQLLGRDNFDISEWASLGKPAVPPGTDLLVIAGPSSSFVPPELAAFSAYLDGGGRMLVLLDPTLGPGEGALVNTNLEAWLARYGVKVGQNIVVDPSNPLPFYGPETIYIKSYGDHPITKTLGEGNVPVLVSLARSIAAGSAPGLKVTELLKTTDQGWGETDLAHLDKVARDARDLAGPVAMGVVAESVAPPAGSPGKRGLRLVVYGDSNFATNQLLQENNPNVVLLSNTVNWLVEREALLDIPAKKTEQVRLTLTSDEIRNIYLLAGVLPLLAVGLGVAVFLRRRRR